MAADNESIRQKILFDLKMNPDGRFYRPKISGRLRKFIEEHVPEVEIVKTGHGETIRLKVDDVKS